MNFELKRKLIYFTLGNNVDYIKLADLCIKSLYKNKYDGDFLFITDLKNEVLSSIHFNKEPYFLDIDKSDLLGSSANKLKLYKFDKINEFDKIVFSDLDILWTDNPNTIFDIINDDKFYMSNEAELMNKEYWGGNLLNEYEKNDIVKNNIFGVNAGIFAFNKNMIKHLEYIDLFLYENKFLVNICLEQPFLNVYLYRMDIYNTILNDYVSHNGYHLNEFNGSVLHFAGGPGNFSFKYDKMLDFYNKNLLNDMKIFETRNDFIKNLDKNLIVCEIGVFKGEFSKIINDSILPKELHLVDPFDGMMCSGDKDGNNIVWVNLTEEMENIKNIFSLNSNVFIHKGFSHDVLKNFEDNYFDVIYIDGDHTYNGVKIDLNLSLKKVKLGGLICGHDYSNIMFPDIVKAVDEFCVENVLKINYITKDGCPTFGIVKK
jgi:hypothetical protein